MTKTPEVRSITTETIGRFLASVIDEHTSLCEGAGQEVYIGPEYDPSNLVDRLYADPTDPNNLILIADGQRFKVSITAESK